MSILKNKRTESRFEYENNFNKIYKLLQLDYNKVAKRRRIFILEPVLKIIRLIHSDIMELSTGYVKDKTEREKWKYDLLKSAITRINMLRKPLLVYWGVLGTKEEKQQQLAELLNKEIILLNGLLSKNENYRKEDSNNLKYIRWIKRKDIDCAFFLKNMRKLLMNTHSKVLHIPEKYRAYEGQEIIELVNDAWYYCVSANTVFPKTQKQLELRHYYLSQAISALHKMNRPMLSLFLTLGYSDRVMEEWAEQLTEQLRLIQAVRKSDKERFKNLPEGSTRKKKDEIPEVLV